MVGDVPGNERAGTGSADEVPLVQKLLVSVQYRQPRDAKVGRETSGGRNPLPWPEATVQNRAAQPVIDLPEDRNAGATVDRKVHRSQSGYADLVGNGDGESTARSDIGR